MSDERITVDYIDLQNRFVEISELVHKTNEPVFIERDGKIDLVLMSLECYRQKHFDLFYPVPEFERADNK